MKARERDLAVFAVLYSTLLYSTLFYSTLLYSIFYSTLLYSTLLYSPLLYPSSQAAVLLAESVHRLFENQEQLRRDCETIEVRTYPLYRTCVSCNSPY